MDTIRLITGLVFLIGGIVLLIVSIFFFPALIYAIIGIIIGIALLVNAGHEDKIERIKSKNPQRVLTTSATNKPKKSKK